MAHIPAPATSPPPAMPAHEPSTVTAPSVPAVTRRRLVSITGLPPNACPTSDATVSAVASTIAANPIVFSISPTSTRSINGAQHSPATNKFAITCAALRPDPSSTSASIFRRRPARVATNVSTNNNASGVNPERTRPRAPFPAPKVTSKQIIPPQTAPPLVAAPSPITVAANAVLTISATSQPDPRPSDTAHLTIPALAPISAVPATHTSARACIRSRSSGIAFLHTSPRISSSISRRAPSVIYNRNLSIVKTSSSAGALLHLAGFTASENTKSRPRRIPRHSAAQTAGHAGLVPAVRAASRLACAVAASSAIALIAGCGASYRPVVSAVNPVGPAAQPGKYAVVISSPSPTSPGLLTFVDFSGDSVLITANVGVNPYYLILNSTGTTGYTLNGDSTLTSFSISTQLLTSQINQTTLLRNPIQGGQNVLPSSIFPQGNFTYVTQPGFNPGGPIASPPLGRNSIAEFTGSPLNLQQELPIDPAFSPIYVAGVASAPRSFVLSQAVNGGPGAVSTIENTTNATIDPNPIPVGRNPVYGVMTADGRRVFIMNQGDGTVSVINAQTNGLDIVPNGSTNPIPVGVAPLWADFAPTRNELVVANAGNGTTPGSASIIRIPLCSSTAQPTNPNCDPNNPVDAAGFGTVLANVPTGLNSVMVAVLQDGSRAYVANSGDPNLPCAPPPAVPGKSTVCSVSVINLTTNTVTQTLYAKPDSTCNSPTSPSICGHPAYIAATTGSPTGKVYVVSKDSTNLSVIRTDTDSMDTIVPLQGSGVSVRVTAP